GMGDERGPNVRVFALAGRPGPGRLSYSDVEHRVFARLNSSSACKAIADGAAHLKKAGAVAQYASFVQPGFAELKKFGRAADRKQLVEIRLRHLCLSFP